jgi:hypothetical protein
MKTIIFVHLFVLFFALFLLAGCDNTAEEPIPDNRWVLPVDMWEQMENIFIKIEDELVHFVDYINENELFDTLEGVHIIFVDDEEGATRENDSTTGSSSVTVYNGEIANLERLWGSVSIFRNDPKFSEIVRAIGEREIIARIIVSGGSEDARIRFIIKPEHPYIVEIRGFENNFYYIEGNAPTRSEIEQIRENWYMEIALE